MALTYTKKLKDEITDKLIRIDRTEKCDCGCGGSSGHWFRGVWIGAKGKRPKMIDDQVLEIQRDHWSGRACRDYTKLYTYGDIKKRGVPKVVKELYDGGTMIHKTINTTILKWFIETVEKCHQ